MIMPQSQIKIPNRKISISQKIVYIANHHTNQYYLPPGYDYERITSGHNNDGQQIPHEFG